MGRGGQVNEDDAIRILDGIDVRIAEGNVVSLPYCAACFEQAGTPVRSDIQGVRTTDGVRAREIRGYFAIPGPVAKHLHGVASTRAQGNGSRMIRFGAAASGMDRHDACLF